MLADLHLWSHIDRGPVGVSPVTEGQRRFLCPLVSCWLRTHYVPEAGARKEDTQCRDPAGGMPSCLQVPPGAGQLGGPQELGAGPPLLSLMGEGGRWRGDDQIPWPKHQRREREGRGHAPEPVPGMTTAGARPPRVAPSQAGPSCGISRLHAQVTSLLTGQHRERHAEQAHPPQAQAGMLVVGGTQGHTRLETTAIPKVKGGLFKWCRWNATKY